MQTPRWLPNFFFRKLGKAGEPSITTSKREIKPRGEIISMRKAGLGGNKHQGKKRRGEIKIGQKKTKHVGRRKKGKQKTPCGKKQINTATLCGLESMIIRSMSCHLRVQRGDARRGILSRMLRTGILEKRNTQEEAPPNEGWTAPARYRPNIPRQ